MSLDLSASCCRKLEEGSITTKNVLNMPKSTNDKIIQFINYIRPITVELFGTTLFVLIGLFGSCNNETLNNSLTSAISFSFSLIICLASFGHISGGHFNPAVTLGVLVAGSLELKKALLYILVQLIGGLVAAGSFLLLSNTTIYHCCYGGTTSLGKVINTNEINRSIFDHIKWWQGLCVESLFTFIFVTVVLIISVDNKAKTNIGPIYNGIALFVCIFATNTITGASFNPARSLGTAIFSNIWSHHYIYWVGPLLGGIIAGSFYRFLWANIDGYCFNDEK